MPAPKRIASLLPGATETCFALGLGDRVVGVSHECDHPPAARERPRLTRTRIDPAASSAEIDRQVRGVAGSGLSIYDVDIERLRELAPELIVTQDACDVCAVSLAEVEAAACELLGADTTIVSLAPLSVGDVLRDVERVARAAGADERGAEVVAGLRARLDALRQRTAPLPQRRVLFLEWLAPPMVAGHWTPELLRAAGGDPIAAHERAPTRATAWELLAATAPEVVVVAPCGFPIAQSLPEVAEVRERFPRARVAVLDGNAFFNRPGPRLVDSAEHAAAVLHPDVFPAPPPDVARVYEP